MIFDVILSKHWSKNSEEELKKLLNNIAEKWDKRTPTSYLLKVSNHTREELKEKISKCLVNSKIKDKTQSFMIFEVKWLYKPL